MIRFEGVIDPWLHYYLYRKLEIAKAEGADLVILEIDSPGGTLGNSLAIAEHLQKLDWARTVAYVPHMALSGAAIVSLGCDDIIMAPDALLGDAGVISRDEKSAFQYVPEKQLSALLPIIRTLAESKGRPAALAEAMLDMNLKVFRAENVKTGKIAYVSHREIEADPGNWKQLGRVAESGERRFLTVRGAKAVEYGLAQGNATSRREVLARYGLDERITVLEPSGVDTAVLILNSPLVTGLILVLGLVGLYIEFMAPGTGFGGLIAALCFVTFFWSHFLGGTAGWLAVSLFLLGVVFVAVELFILPGFAVSGIVGGLLMVASLIMAMTNQRSLIPEDPQELWSLTTTLLTIFLSFLGFVIAAVLIRRRFGALPLFGRLALAPPDAAAAGAGTAGRPLATDGFAPPPVHVGDVGLAQTPLRPGGKGRFGDHLLDVLADGDFILQGRRIQVVRVSGMQVVVEEAGT